MRRAGKAADKITSTEGGKGRLGIYKRGYLDEAFIDAFMDRMHELRTASGATREDMAEHVGVKSPSMISFYENRWGEGSHRQDVKPCPPLDVIVAYADFFGVSLDWIFRGHEFERTAGDTALEADLLRAFRELPSDTWRELIVTLAENLKPKG